MITKFQMPKKPKAPKESKRTRQARKLATASDAEKTYFEILLGDVWFAEAHLVAEDSDVARRDVVRATLAAVEGYLWWVKQEVHRYSSRTQTSSLSMHELAALMEESYSVRDNGTVIPQPRYLPTATSFRVTVRIAEKFFEGFEIDFEHVGWECLRRTIDVRNRITHPKTVNDLHVSKKELEDCDFGFRWFLAFFLEALLQITNALEAQRSLARTKRPKPDRTGPRSRRVRRKVPTRS